MLRQSQPSVEKVLFASVQVLMHQRASYVLALLDLSQHNWQQIELNLLRTAKVLTAPLALQERSLARVIHHAHLVREEPLLAQRVRLNAMHVSLVPQQKRLA